MNRRWLVHISVLLWNVNALAQWQKTELSDTQIRSTLASTPRYALLNINNLTSWMRADGLSNHSPKGDNGAYFPRGTANVIYQDGILWGGKAYLDSAKTQPAPFGQVIRIGGARYVTSCREGWINGFGASAMPADPNDPRARIYRIRRDYFFMSEIESVRDAAENYELDLSEVTDEQTKAIKERYVKDWAEWPVDLGAPYIDRNRNGRYDPPPFFSDDFTPDNLISGGYDEPGIQMAPDDGPADQAIWTVYNSVEHDETIFYQGYSPLGLEIQITIWAYKSNDLMRSSYFFRRVRMINKGGVVINDNNDRGAFWIDSMYVGQWSDADLGTFGDDLVGCDTSLNLGYIYNSDGLDEEYFRFHLPPPAAGYCIVQGPRIRSPADSAIFDFKYLLGWKNRAMAAFYFDAPSSFYEPPCCQQAAESFYKALRGFSPLIVAAERYLPFPPGITPGPFPFSGDPVRRTGFTDGLGTTYSPPPGDRRLTISSGPFSLAPGDTQEVVIAFVAGIGADRLSSISVTKFIARRVRLWYPSHPQFSRPEEYPPPVLPPNYFTLAQNYPNPFNAETRIDYTIPEQGEVKLAIYDLLGREVAVLKRARLEPGDYTAFWDGRDAKERSVPSGIYFYRLQAAGYIELTKKLLLLR
jgi:hypothetical protein